MSNHVLYVSPMELKALQEALTYKPLVVFPGEAHVNGNPDLDAHDWDFDDVMPPDEDTDHVSTLPTAFPAAPAAPELCKLAYYGIRCDIQHCKDPVHREKANP